MHIEILIEDASGKLALENIVPKILGKSPHTYRIISYKGIGRIPPGLRNSKEAKKRILLDQLPRLLRGYGDAHSKCPANYKAAVMVVVDSDKKDCKRFKAELMELFESCRPRPKTLFRIAIEELEAWFLGDAAALRTAFPNAKTNALQRYVQDSICGTWELMADTIYPNGGKGLKAKGWPEIGQVKCDWATKISRHMDIDRNQSPSFNLFKSGLLTLAEDGT